MGPLSSRAGTTFRKSLNGARGASIERDLTGFELLKKKSIVLARLLINTGTTQPASGRANTNVSKSPIGRKHEKRR